MKIIATDFQRTVVFLDHSHFLSQGEIKVKRRKFLNSQRIRNVGIVCPFRNELELRFNLEVFDNINISPLGEDSVPLSLKNLLLLFVFLLIDLFDD